MKHAILCQLGNGSYHLYQRDHTTEVEFPASLEGFLPFFEKYDVNVLWCMPNTHFSKFIQWEDFEKLDKDRVRVFPTRPTKNQKRPGFVSIRRATGRKFEPDRYLAFPAHIEWSADGEWFLPSPYILVETLRCLHTEFDVQPLWGPGNMGMKVLQRTFVKKQWHVDNTELTPQLRSVLNKAMVRPVWRRYHGLMDEQKRMLFLHGYDKRGQFLGAAQSVMLGSGRPEWVDGGDFSLKSIGFWQYKIKDVRHSAFNGYELPCPLDVNRQWASTDLLAAARAVDIEFDVLEGVVWPDGKKYLEPWAKEMWSHRVNLQDAEKYRNLVARENAAGTAKSAANMLMGRLATSTNDLYRPDWNLGIVHRAIASQVYSFRKILQDHGIKPVLVTTDSFWIVSNDPNPATAIPGILDHQHEQRGFRHLGTAPMNQTIIDLFSVARPESISGYLKERAEEYVESI